MLPDPLERAMLQCLFHGTFWSLRVVILCLIKVGNELESLVTFAKRNGTILFRNS